MISTIEQQKVIQKITWDTFQKEYLPREDKYKYEWVDGIVEKSSRMNQEQFYIQRNLLRFFYQLSAKNDIKGDLIVEGDAFFGTKHRRPDLAYYSDGQILLAEKRENVTPLFVIEVISNNDQMNLVYRKMRDYREAKVKVVWHIFPELKEVHIYQNKTMEIKSGEDRCDANIVIQGFEMSVDEIFKLK